MDVRWPAHPSADLVIAFGYDRFAPAIMVGEVAKAIAKYSHDTRPCGFLMALRGVYLDP